jgi:drug/metabolite transporter (DMT)-like permease
VPFFLAFVRIDTSVGLIALTLAITMMFELAVILYNMAILREEASRVATLVYIGPLFVLPLAAVFLGEVLTFGKYLGVLLLVAGAITVSYKRTARKAGFSSALWLMLLFTIVWSVYEVASKYILTGMDFWSFTFWWLVGSVLTGCLMSAVPDMRHRFTSSVKKVGCRALAIRTAVVASWHVSLLSMFFAISAGPVSLVAAIPSVQPLFVLAFALFLTRFAPQIMREKFDRATAAVKLAAVLLVVAGAWLVTS